MGFDLVKAQTLMESWFPNSKQMLNEDQYSTKQGRHAISYMKQRGVTDPDKQRQIIDALMGDLEMHNTNDPRFNYLVGCTRLYLDRQLNNVEDINHLKMVLKYVSDEGHQGQYDENLNNLSLAELTQRFQKLQAQDAEKSRSDVDSLGYGTKSQTGYRIVKIDTDEQAREYYKYHGGLEKKFWCITHGSFSGYKLDDVNQCYFCLKDGFETMTAPENPENAPFDEFGLSMVSVIVGYDGEPTHVTTRWNHEHNGENNPELYTAEQVSRLIGVNFYQVFKPNEKGMEMQRRFREAQANLDSGMSPEEVFDWVGNFKDDIAKVVLNDKYNFINTEDRVLSNTWFDSVYCFENGFAEVVLNGKYNFIDTEGRLLSDTWFDSVGDFLDGVGRVALNGKYNFINTERRIISDTWFDWADNFSNGFASVELKGKWNFIDTEGRILSDTWFNDAYNFENGFAEVALNGKYNFIDTKGRIISDTWFDSVGDFLDGFARVGLNGKYNFIDTKGRIISDTWFDEVDNFENGFASVELKGKWNYIDTEGRLLSDTGVDWTGDFSNGFAQVILNGEYYYIDTEGNLYDLNRQPIQLGESRIDRIIRNVLNEMKNI